METKGVVRTFVVAFNHANGDKPVLLVGEKDFTHGVMNVIKAVEGQEAIDIYKKLVKEE